MHNFVVHSNESECRKGGRLGLDQVYFGVCFVRDFTSKHEADHVQSN